MIDLAFVRGNLALVEEKLRARGMDPAAALGNFAAIDRERRDTITQLETLKAQRNKLTEEIAKLRKSGGDATAQTEQTRVLKSEVESLETVAMTADERLREIMQTLPNLPQDSVPIGKDEHSNRQEKLWGEQPKFDFAPKPHWELGEALGILDFNRAAKISGARFVVHFGQGARLERALANFMLDLHTREHGYTEVLPPSLVNSKSLFGTGQLPPSSPKTSSIATIKAPTRPAFIRTTITGSSPPLRSRSLTSFATRPSKTPNSPSPSAPTLPASAARLALMGRMCAG